MCITKIQDDGEQRTKKDNEWTLNICGQLLCVRHLLTVFLIISMQLLCMQVQDKYAMGELLQGIH